jgi:hypothetical protein
VDRRALVTLLLQVSDLVTERPEIVELDLNPVIARPDGLELVDVRVVVHAGVGGRTEVTTGTTFGR